MNATTTAARNAHTGRFEKARATEDVVDVEDKTAAFSDMFGTPDEQASFSFDEMKMAMSMTFGMLGVRHPIAGFIVGLVGGAFGIYSAMQVGAWLGTAALAFTGSMFIGCLVAFLVAFVAALSAMRAASMAAKYVAMGGFEDDYQAAKTWTANKFSAVRGWFSKSTDKE